MAGIIKFVAGAPEVVALKFDEGKIVDGRFGPQMAFTTTDDRIFYLDNEPADDMVGALRQYGISRGTPFKLTKIRAQHGGYRWQVEPYEADRNGHRQPAAPPPVAPPAAPPSAPAATAAGGASSGLKSDAACMMAAMCSAVDAILETQAYATRKGLGLTFSEESVRAIGLSIYITNCKGGR
jgi:hypothetical protein